MAGLFVVGGAILQTGLAQSAGNSISRMAKGNETRAFIYVVLATSFIGAFVSNTGTVAIMMPIIMSMAASSGIRSSSLVVRTPVAVSTIRADRATTSPRTRPQTNMAIVTIRTIIVMVMNQTQISELQIYNNPATITNAARAMASDLIKP